MPLYTRRVLLFSFKFFFMIYFREMLILTIMRFFVLIFSFIALFALQTAVADEKGKVHLEPIASHSTTVFSEERTRLLGPIYEKRIAADGSRMLAVRPFYGSSYDPERNITKYQVLWPIWTGKRMKKEFQWRFASLGFWRDWDTSSPASRYTFRFFPVYFQGRDKTGKFYLGVFPLGGTIRELLGQDKICFCLFPLTAYARRNEVRTYTFIWPIVSRTKGSEIERFRVFPFYGRSKLRADYDKCFILWPFWTSAKYGYTGSSGSGYILFPLCGHIKLENQESWLFLPPLFRFSKAEGLHDVNCPWPFFQYSSGNVDKLYFWPVWCRKRTENHQSLFLLWPFFSSLRYFEPDGERHRFSVLPVVFGETKWSIDKQKGNEKNVLHRSLKVFPLFSYQRDRNKTNFSLFSLCPLRGFEEVEQLYAPFWTIYSHARCGNDLDDELFWGLFKYRRSGKGQMYISLFPLFSIKKMESDMSFSWSFLHGLIGYTRMPARRVLKLLYVFKIPSS